MVRHIVLFKLKEGVVDDDRTKLVEVLKELKEKVEVVRELEVGVDIGKKGNSYDVSLTTVFDSMADMEAYSVHPDHMKAVEFIKSVCDGVTKVDYEF